MTMNLELIRIARIRLYIRFATLLFSFQCYYIKSEVVKFPLSKDLTNSFNISGPRQYKEIFLVQ